MEGRTNAGFEWVHIFKGALLSGARLPYRGMRAVPHSLVLQDSTLWFRKVYTCVRSTSYIVVPERSCLTTIVL